MLGICNGFQILCESGLLPGALLRNAGLRYICKQVHIRTETTRSPFTQALTTRPGIEKSPSGIWRATTSASPTPWQNWSAKTRIAFRYCTPAGEVTSAANPNGSISGIAGDSRRRATMF